jgi:hypothetical protein
MKDRSQEFRTIGDVEYKLGSFHNGVFHYDLSLVLNYLEKLGQYLFPYFKIHPIDIPVIEKLCIYFLGSEKKSREIGLPQNKGLLLFGNVGVGKTNLLQLIPLIKSTNNSIPAHNADQLAQNYTIEGAAALKVINFNRSFILDDIGSDRSVRNYGNTTEVIADIIKKFADKKNELVDSNMVRKYGAGFHQKNTSIRTVISKNVVVHATTNCDADTIRNRYDERTISRMNQLFSVLNFDVDSVDKRMADV